MSEMTDAEKLAAIRDLLSRADLHRNREKRDALEVIRDMLGVPEGPEGAEPTDSDLGEKDASNDSGGTLDDGLDAMGRAELNAIAKAAGLDIKGKQPALIARIREHRAATALVVDETETATDDAATADTDGGEATDAESAATEDGAEPTAEDETAADESERQAPRVAPDDAAESVE